MNSKYIRFSSQEELDKAEELANKEGYFVVSGKKTNFEYIKNYYANAKIEITTNGVFNNPENKFLRMRTWFDPQASIKKDQLRNKGEISNICDEILARIEELLFKGE